MYGPNQNFRWIDKYRLHKISYVIFSQIQQSQNVFWSNWKYMTYKIYNFFFSTNSLKQKI